MARTQRRAGETPAPRPTGRFGKRPPRHRFFLNPYTDARFTSCPQCQDKTLLRKVPLVMHVEPHDMLVLNKTCRYCPRCDLLVAHQDELEGLLAAHFGQHKPEVVGNDYLVLGTMDRADWRRGTRALQAVTELPEYVHDFLEHADFEVVGGWMPVEPQARGASSATPTELTSKDTPRELERRRSSAPAAGTERESQRERPSVPVRLRPLFDEIVGLTDAVCREHLNEEYGLLCRRLAAALCRKRPSPVTRGRPAGWACGIAYQIGAVNFLFDPSQTPHYKASELCALFGVSTATGTARAMEIRRMFGMVQMDPEWCLPSKLDENPLAWLILVDGIPIDARHESREVQEGLLRRGLIPYLPDRRPE